MAVKSIRFRCTLTQHYFRYLSIYEGNIQRIPKKIHLILPHHDYLWIGEDTFEGLNND